MTEIKNKQKISLIILNKNRGVATFSLKLLTEQHDNYAKLNT